MFLFEFEGVEGLKRELTHALSAYKSELQADSKKRGWKPPTKKEFLHKLYTMGITLDARDLPNMLKKAPFKNFISNISDDAVTFFDIGNDNEIDTEKTKDQKKDTVAKMAKSAQTLPQTGPAVPPLPDLGTPAGGPPMSAPPM